MPSGAARTAVGGVPQVAAKRPCAGVKKPLQKASTVDYSRPMRRRWIKLLTTWSVGFEPVVADQVISFLVRSQLLSPSVVVHYARGMAKWRPPATRHGLEPWFVNELAASSAAVDGSRPPIPVAIMHTRLHAVIHSAYGHYGRSLSPSGNPGVPH